MFRSPSNYEQLPIFIKSSRNSNKNQSNRGFHTRLINFTPIDTDPTKTFIDLPRHQLVSGPSHIL